MHACLRHLQPCKWQIGSVPLAKGDAGSCMSSGVTFAKMGLLDEALMMGMLWMAPSNPE